jgi:hypothetical protein
MFSLGLRDTGPILPGRKVVICREELLQGLSCRLQFKPACIITDGPRSRDVPDARS